MTSETKLEAGVAPAEAVAPRLRAVPNQAPAKPAGKPPAAKPKAVPPGAKPNPAETRPLPKSDASVQKAIRRAKAQRNRLVIGSLLAMVVLPTLIAALYMFVIASDRYVVESRFAVRGNEQSGVSDLMGFFTGAGATSTTNDSYILQDFVGSRELVDRLEKRIDIRGMYSTPAADFLTRYRGDDTVEDFVGYFRGMVTATFDHYSGIVNLKVQAFTPTDAKIIADAVVEECDALINRISEKSRRDSVLFAEHQLAETEARLKSARGAVEQFQTNESTVDPTAKAAANEALIAGLDEQLMKTQSQVAELRKFVNEDSPQVQVLKSRIEVLKSQLAERKKRVGAERSSGAPDSEGIGAQLSTYKALQLDEEFAQKAYVSALASLEMARANASRDQRYLATYVYPAVPEQALLPERGLGTLLVLVASLIVWGIASLLFAAVRDHVI